MRLSREEIEDAIDAARASTLRPLSLIVVRMARPAKRGLSRGDLSRVRADVLHAVAKLMASGATTPAIANQLGTIVDNKAVDAIRSTARERRQLVHANTVQLERIAGSDDVESEVIANEGLERLVAALNRLHERHERSYEAIYAKFHGLPVAQHLTARFGENVSEDSARKILERARARLSLLLAETENVS